ncbi:hypothetical protein OG379_36210 [Streptomyces sp. NBC_01166]|uniref:hypothetical protein n=1 Tax=Streptomyces sp. NBC_01166 TaxID=2903755 RepID=UPI0038657026|nr:hypothetical protein OG379_36210 [Streptomyces sp. NBC_01166]
MPFTVAAIAMPLQFLVGDMIARQVYGGEPANFSAMELLPTTGPTPRSVPRSSPLPSLEVRRLRRRVRQAVADVVGDYLFLAWFITAITMIGGAFGTSLEGDEKVSDAAYGRRHRERQRILRQMSRPEPGERWGPDTTDG